MLIDVGFLDHRKTRKLGILMGAENTYVHVAVLIRLWEYCQRKRLWKFEATPDDLADICQFYGDAELLVKSLEVSRWITYSGGKVEVVNWEKHNKRLIQCWEIGRKGGRPPKENTPKKKPNANPKKTQRKPNANHTGTNLDLDLELERKENTPTGYKRKGAFAPKPFFISAWESEENADLREQSDAESLKSACLDFIEHRETMRPPRKLTKVGVRRMFSHLRKVEPPIAVAMIEDAIDRGHQAWYFEEKAQRFSRNMAGKPGLAVTEPMNPLLSDDGPDPWR